MYVEINCTSIIYIACLLVIIFGDTNAKKIALWVAGIVFALQLGLFFIGLILFSTF